MSSAPSRRYLTEWLLDLLSSHEIIASIIDASLSGGWSDDPRSTDAYYQPYTVITPLTASRQSGTLFDLGLDWELSYALTSYSTSTAGIEDQADTARRIVLEAPREKVHLGDEVWKVIGTVADNIGAVTTNRAVEPPVLSQQDSVTIRVSKV